MQPNKPSPIDPEANYYATRALIQDARRRGDTNALEVAASLHRDALAIIKRHHEMSTLVDKMHREEPGHATA